MHLDFIRGSALSYAFSTWSAVILAVVPVDDAGERVERELVEVVDVGFAA
jgi:hypothetical protein